MSDQPLPGEIETAIELVTVCWMGYGTRGATGDRSAANTATDNLRSSIRALQSERSALRDFKGRVLAAYHADTDPEVFCDAMRTIITGDERRTDDLLPQEGRTD